MLKRIIWLVVLSVLLAGCPAAAWAGRVLAVPTADVADKQLQLEYGYHRGQSLLDFKVGILPGLNIGVRQEFKGNFSGIFKAAVMEETQSYPGLAVGGEISVKARHIYAVLSKQLGFPGFRGHLAVGTGRYALGMAGLSLMLNPVQVKTKWGIALPTASLAAEYDGMGLNVGLTARFSPSFQGYLALFGGQRLGFGFNYKAEF